MPETRALMRDDAGKDPLQQERIGQRGAIAILRTDRLREPVQLASAATGPFDPRAVVPPDGGVAERVVVLHGARRAGGAMGGDVDLLGDVQLAPQVIDQQARQPGLIAAPTTRTAPLRRA